MRIVGEIPHPECRITLLSWNNRYLIKVEQGLMEQTFKINQFDLSSEGELLTLLDDEFISECLRRFNDMNQSLVSAMQRLES
jgi:hypothetical protein